MESQNKIEHPGHEFKEQEHEIKELEHKLKEQEHEIKELEHELKEQEHEIKELEHEIKEHERKVTVFVNEQPVELDNQTVTGANIKSAAIAQGVLIQQNFVLQEELPNGTSRIIGDNDPVCLHEHLRFTAIAPDDNS